MTLAEAHIEAERRLRETLAAFVTRVWAGLGHYDRQDVGRFTSVVVPAVLAAQRASVAVTDAYLARALERQPVGLDPEALSGAGVRNGTPPEEVYARPFVTVWSALQRGDMWEQAVSAGAARAESSAQMDVALSMSHSLRAIGRADRSIAGWRRVPNPGACTFCRTVSTRLYHTSVLMPLHNRCGCGVEPVTDRSAPFVDDLSGDGVAVNQHGELGPVLGDPAQSFDAR